MYMLSIIRSSIQYSNLSAAEKNSLVSRGFSAACLCQNYIACSPLLRHICNTVFVQLHRDIVFAFVYIFAFDCDSTSSASASPCSGLQPASWSLFPPCACWYTHFIHPLHCTDPFPTHSDTNVYLHLWTCMAFCALVFGWLQVRNYTH